MKESSEVRLPLFVVAGMPRGGTTFLYHNLRKHPMIFLPYRKEINYFNVRYDRGVSWYHSLFKGRQAHQVAGDISAPCFMEPDFIKRVKAYTPETKIILVVRDPVEWALSFYRQFQTFTFRMPSFADFLEGYDYRINNKVLRIEFKNDTVVKRIESFRKAFGAKLFLYDFAYFRNHTLEVLQTIERFLGVEPFFREGTYDNLRINASQRKNVRLVSYVLSREWLISSLQYLFPRSMTLYFRDKFDRRSVNKHVEQQQYTHPEELVRLAEKELGGQRTVIRQMFSSYPLQIGTGQQVP